MQNLMKPIKVEEVFLTLYEVDLFVAIGGIHYIIQCVRKTWIQNFVRSYPQSLKKKKKKL
jgi:hypothetical protein